MRQGIRLNGSWVLGVRRVAGGSEYLEPFVKMSRLHFQGQLRRGWSGLLNKFVHYIKLMELWVTVFTRGAMGVGLKGIQTYPIWLLKVV